MLSRNTEIMMADGSAKYIQYVEVGEKLLTQNNVFCKVIDILAGPEDSMLDLTAGNKTIRVSNDQVIVTTSSLKRALDIKAGDKLISISGQEVEVRSISFARHNDTVYQFVLEGGYSFFAGDILVGDFKTETEPR